MLLRSYCSEENRCNFVGMKEKKNSATVGRDVREKEQQDGKEIEDVG